MIQFVCYRGLGSQELKAFTAETVSLHSVVQDLDTTYLGVSTVFVLFMLPHPWRTDTMAIPKLCQPSCGPHLHDL